MRGQNQFFQFLHTRPRVSPTKLLNVKHINQLTETDKILDSNDAKADKRFHGYRFFSAFRVTCLIPRI
jgi:hypothetical protein